MTRVCRICGIEKPIDQYRFHDRSRGRRVTACNTCLNLKQHEYRKHLSHREAERMASDAWDHDDRPATMGPIRKPWDLTCLSCGEQRQFLWTPEEARRVSLHLVTKRPRCERCGGWLLLEPGLQAFDDPTRRGRAAA